MIPPSGREFRSPGQPRAKIIWRTPAASDWIRGMLFPGRVTPIFFPARTLLACAALFLPAATNAHPIHRSIAEASYNGATRTLEFALRVFADDFEATLGARAKKKISLEKTAATEFDALAHAYLAETFIVKSADDQRPAFRWIRREFKKAENELWFYFETTLPAGIEGTKIRHAALTDRFRDQLNSVLVRDGTRKQTLFFLPTHGEKTVRFPP
ncbi:MAG: hypothetical protein EXS37_05970 [Opitutus sp.]|nr:hypothetical protein [Opitutus sp.]